jgi:1-pyrroline-5-carboxylate dehydrogenase
VSFRITYSVLDADMSELHREFDAALQQVHARKGLVVPSWVNGQPRTGGPVFESRCPMDSRVVVSRAHAATDADIDAAVRAAAAAAPAWAATPFSERNAILRRAADLISERRMRYAAIMALEVGKNRLESLGDVEESADLIRYYAGQIETANGFEHPLTRLSPNEDVRSVLRPFGVFAVVAPFNFPMALAAGMSSGALVAGNTVVLKPSEDAPWVAECLYECLRDAGLPAGVFHIVHGTGAAVGEPLVRHPLVAGLAFTGSTAVGRRLFAIMNEGRNRPAMLEMGGKNACIVNEDADIAKAAAGCWKSAFGLSGQKCSALSRIYVHRAVAQPFVDALLEHTRAIRVGDPTRADVYMGPVINGAAVARFEQAVLSVSDGGQILAGGKRLVDGEFEHGHYVEPTVVMLPADHELHRRELFLPFVGVTVIDSLEQALTLANDSDYGLTGGYYGASTDGIQTYLDHIEAGCVYVNRAAGATTGAWPGVQAFCGWKGSGSTGKGGCGPWYVSQFLREQSRTHVQ